jgi:hypothetical protein
VRRREQLLDRGYRANRACARAVGLAAWRAATPTINTASSVGMAVTATSRSSLAKLKSTLFYPSDKRTSDDCFYAGELKGP